MAKSSASRAWYCLLVLPYLALLWPGLYARSAPAFAGIPFFYWWQLVWLALTAVLTGIVYLRVVRR